MAPAQTITLSAMRDWAERIGLPLSEAELPKVAAEITAGRAAMAALWAVDLGALEPIVIFDAARDL